MKKIIQIISIAIVSALAIQIIIGGILLPVKQANAGLCSGSIVIDPITNVATAAYKAFETGVKWAWENAKAAWEKISSMEMLKNIKLGNVISGAKSLYEKVKPYVEKAAGIAWNVLKKKMLTELVNSIIKNIQGENSKPKFVTDWKGFITDAGNQAAGQFIEEDPNLNFLCDNFGTEIKVALGTVPPFGKEYIGCTLDDVITNLEDFYDDMRKGGGWNGWLKVSENQNNVFGAYWTVMGEKLSKETKAKEAATNKAMAGSGFLGTEKCLEWGNCNEDLYKSLKNSGNSEYESREASCTCKKMGTVTPGKVLADSASKSITSDIDWLISAKEFSEYAGAIFDAAFNRMAREGLAFMQTDNYKPSESYDYDYLMNDLNKQEGLIDRMVGDQLNGGDNSFNIATRQGQRKIMVEFRKILISLKNNVKQAVKLLQTQKENADIMVECADFKYDMCKTHAAQYASTYKETICKEIKGGCLSEKNASCAANNTSCQQIGIQQCNDEYSKCFAIADSVFPLVMQDRCDSPTDATIVIEGKEVAGLKLSTTIGVGGSHSIFERKEMAEGFKDSLNAQEELINLTKVYTLLPFDRDSTNKMLQKLENYKPFDECGEELCAESDNAFECQEMAWFNPLKKDSFINGNIDGSIVGKCQNVPSETKEKCALLKDAASIQDCEKNWKDECKAEWAQKTDRKVSENNEAEKNLFGACYTRKVFVVSDSYEDFTQNFETLKKVTCGETPSQECSKDVFEKIDDPLNKCLWEEIPRCTFETKKTDIECYNDLTTPPAAISSNPSGFLGKCYDEQYRDLTYDSLLSDEFTRINDSDIEFMTEVQDGKHEEYSQLDDTLKQDLLSMSRSGEKCQDKSTVPDAEYNKYELENACVINSMTACAPLVLTGNAWDYMRGTSTSWHGNAYKIKYTFPTNEKPPYETWESFWRGCYKCTSCMESQCKDNMDCSCLCESNCSFEPQCKTWWLRKDSTSPFEMLNQTASKIDIWNIYTSYQYWPNTQWKILFDFSIDYDGNGKPDKNDMEEYVKEILESGIPENQLESVILNMPLIQNLPAQTNSDVEGDCLTCE